MRVAISRIATRLVGAVVLAALLAWGDSASAAEKRLSWSDDACTYSIGFDPAKSDEVKLRNTLHLLFGPSDFKVPVVVLPQTPGSISKTLDLDRTTSQCREALDIASRLEFLSLDGIEDYRGAKIAEITDSCAFSTAKIRGLRDPAALRAYAPAAAACSVFIDALEGKSAMLTVFQDTLNRNCSRNGSPATCVARQVANSQRVDGMDWVKLYLVTFGWNNCAVKFMSTNAEGKKLSQMRAQLEAQFRRQFKVTKDKCEDTGEDGHPEFGSSAVIDTDIAPRSEWTITNLGLFCGSAKFHPGRIMAYVYGIGYERLRTGQPLGATLEIDGKPTELLLEPYDDVALTPLDGELVRNLLGARSASVHIKDYKSGRPDRLKLDGVGAKIHTALKTCFKS